MATPAEFSFPATAGTDAILQQLSVGSRQLRHQLERTERAEARLERQLGSPVRGSQSFEESSRPTGLALEQEQGVQVSRGSTLFDNGTYEPLAAQDDSWDGVAAELQAARLRLEGAESERDVLATELAATQCRLQNALEVLEGLLGERTALIKQAHDLQEQLAAALQEQRGGQQRNLPRHPGSEASSKREPGGVPTEATPQRQLRQELMLAQAQLCELRQQQQAWEGERQQMLVEVEEERQRLQEGLAEALGHANCAQREADAAAERAAHWCSLAHLLQRSALGLPDSPNPASPGSLASLCSPAGSAAKVLSAARCRSRGCSTPGGALTAGRSPNLLPRRQLGASSAKKAAAAATAGAHAEGGAGEGADLIAAFHAVAAAASPLAPAEPEQLLQGSPVLLRCESPAQLPACRSHSSSGCGKGVPGVAGTAGADAEQQSSDAWSSRGAELGPGSHLGLLHQLPTPGQSAASSLCASGQVAQGSGGSVPLTPTPCAAVLGKVLVTPAAPTSTITAASVPAPSTASPGGHGESRQADWLGVSPGSSTATARREHTGALGAGQPSKPATVHRGGFLQRLLVKSVCATGAAAAAAADQ